MQRVVFLFFFLSGFSSLVFEIIWARMLQQVFGTTSFAISTLLTAFMAGLAVGSYLGGRLANRVGDQLRLYGILEGCIGAYALMVPVMLEYLPTLYGLLFEHFIDDFYVFSLLRFAAVFSILFIPTTLMGATLPLVSQWLAQRQRLFQGSIGLLYGANTLGACIGCFAAGFFLLPALGLSMTNSLFAAINFALCAVVLLTSPRIGKSEPSIDDADFDDAEFAEIVGGRAHADPHPRWAVQAALICFGITGLVAMSYQVLWTRAYLITLGSSTYSFTLVLTTVLIAIAAGSAVMSPWIKRIARPLLWFSLAQFGAAAAAAISFYTLNRVPLWLFERIRDPITHISEIYLFQFGLVALVVFVPSFLQGMSFPLVIRVVTGRSEQTGSDVGNAYAYNTTGAIFGSFAAGFILMPWLGLQQAITLVIVLNLALAIALAIVELLLCRKVGHVLALGLAFATALGFYGLSPALNQAQLTAGVFRAQTARDVLSSQTFDHYDPEILYYQDGLTATTTVERHGERRVLKSNGKPEASDGADMPTQVVVGLLPFLVRSAYDDVDIGDEKAAMIGFGSGVTAGSSLQWPLARLDVIEIESTMIEASRYFEHVNHRPLEDDRLHVVESDGRNFLEYTSQSFDIIISEPSNPWIAGVSSLFTIEFFERARQRLNEGGIYAQWVQLYEMRPENVRTVFETFRTVFPYVHAYSSRPKGTDLILIGSERPLPLPAEGYARAWEIDRVASEMQRVGISSPHDLYGLLFMNQEQLISFADGAEPNTDDNGLLEFSAPRDVIFYGDGQQFFVDWYFGVDDYGDPRPHFTDWPEGPAWTTPRLASLARSLWVAGKPALTHQLLEDAGYLYDQDSPWQLHPEGIDSVVAVLRASQLTLKTVVATHWPNRDSELHDDVRQALATNSANAALNKFSDIEVTDDQYEPEQGLYRAVLLTAARRYRDAERQLDQLASQGALSDDPTFQFLRGDVLRVRRRYAESYEAYLAHAELSAGHKKSPQ